MVLERTFLDEFIEASTDTSAGRLARALSFDQSFVDLSLSTIEIEAVEISVGKPVGLVLVQKDQFNKDAKCTNLSIEISITSADDVVTHDLAFEQDLQNQNSPQPTSSNTSLNTDDQQNWRLGQVIGNDGFQTLKQLQMKERSTSVYLNKARYKTLTMMPAFTNYSLEELRFAFQKAIDIKETYKLIYNQQTGFFAIDWKPKKPGRFRIDCTIDGFKLGSTTFIEVNERRTPSLSPRNIFQQNDAIEKEEKLIQVYLRLQLEQLVVDAQLHGMNGLKMLMELG
uniref:Uncharacterized protein n=1 Tax=Panagrolaimus davidi TaxID=227884 RepID=A0A914Q2P5_9BILA